MSDLIRSRLHKQEGIRIPSIFDLNPEEIEGVRNAAEFVLEPDMESLGKGSDVVSPASASGSGLALGAKAIYELAKKNKGLDIDGDSPELDDYFNQVAEIEKKYGIDTSNEGVEDWIRNIERAGITGDEKTVSELLSEENLDFMTKQNNPEYMAAQKRAQLKKVMPPEEFEKMLKAEEQMLREKNARKAALERSGKGSPRERMEMGGSSDNISFDDFDVDEDINKALGIKSNKAIVSSELPPVIQSLPPIPVEPSESSPRRDPRQKAIPKMTGVKEADDILGEGTSRRSRFEDISDAIIKERAQLDAPDIDVASGGPSVSSKADDIIGSQKLLDAPKGGVDKGAGWLKRIGKMIARNPGKSLAALIGAGVLTVGQLRLNDDEEEVAPVAPPKANPKASRIQELRKELRGIRDVDTSAGRRKLRMQELQDLQDDINRRMQ